MERLRFEGMGEIDEKEVVNGKENEKRKRMVKFLCIFDEGKVENLRKEN